MKSGSHPASGNLLRYREALLVHRLARNTGWLSTESEGWLLRRPRQTYPTIYLGLGFLQTLFLFCMSSALKFHYSRVIESVTQKCLCKNCSIPPQPRFESFQRSMHRFSSPATLEVYTPCGDIRVMFFSLWHTASSRWAEARYSIRHLRKVIRNVGASDAPRCFLLANAARGFQASARQVTSDAQSWGFPTASRKDKRPEESYAQFFHS